MENDTRLFKRQFILTDVNGFDLSWPGRPVNQFTLYTHPDLAVTEVKNNDLSCILLGFIFDWEFPEKSDSDILRDVLSVSNMDSLTRGFDKYSGQFVVIAFDERDVIIFNDACGQREVYYDSGFSVIGSQPILLNRILAVPKQSGNEFSEFYGSTAFRKDKGYIGDTTQYSNIRHLRPNHPISTRHRKVWRFYPDTALNPVSTEVVVDTVISTLRGFISAASRRYGLRLGVTAGYDSRVLFLASLGSECTYYVSRSNAKGNAVDIRIAKHLAAAHAKTLQVTSYGNDDVPSEDRKILDQSMDFPMYRVIAGKPSMDQLVVNGNISEIARNYFSIDNRHTGRMLARVNGYGGVKFVEKQYDSWLEQNAELLESLDFHPLDMFYWEEKMGNWKARSKTAAAFNTEVWSPFNCRSLLETLLGSDRDLRDTHFNRLYDMIIRTMSAKAAQMPVNPSWKVRVIKLLKSVGLYKVYRKIGLQFGWISS